MAEQKIDELVINITSKADANMSRNLDGVIESLESLKNVMQNANPSITNLGKLGTNFGKLADGVKKIQGAKLNMSGLKNIADQLNGFSIDVGGNSLGDNTKSLSKLSNQINRFQKVINEFNVDKNKLKEVVDSVETLNKGLAKVDTSAINLAELTKQVQRLNKAVGRLGSTKTTKAGTNFFGVMSKKIFNIYLARQFAQVISSGIKEANNYIETMNLFEVAFEGNTKKILRWSSKLSEQLGIDAAQINRYAATYMELSKALGITSERAEIMAINLTQLTYDIASLKNLDFETSFLKLRSGLVGEIEPLRAVGYDISNAALQTKAYSLGLQELVTNMTQADKATLRYLVLMDKTVAAQADLGKTLMSPANALRVLKASFIQLSRAIGYVFIPLLQTAIPLVKLFIDALTQLAQSLADFMGFEMPSFNADAALSSTADLMEDIGDETEDATKKLKDFTLGFDELHTIDDGSSSLANNLMGNSILDGIELPEYDMLAKFTNTSDAKKIKEFVEEFVSGFSLLKDLPAFETIVEVLRKLYDVIKDMINLVKDNPEGAGKAMALLTDISLGLFALYKGKQAGKWIISTLPSIGAAVSGFLGKIGSVIAAHPVGATILAIAGIITGLATLSSYEKKLKDQKGWELFSDEFFGNITLSSEELEKLASNVLWTDWSDNLDLASEKMRLFKSSLEDAVKAGADFETQFVSISLNTKIDEESSANLKNTLQNFIDEGVSSIDAGLDSFNFALSVAGLDDEFATLGRQAYANLKDTYRGIGEKLRAEINNALADGVLSAEEQKVIINLQNEMTEILQKVADAEFKAELEKIKFSYGGSGLTPENFQDFINEIRNKIQEQQLRLQSDVAVPLYTSVALQLDQNLISDEEYQQKIQEINDNLAMKSAEVELKGITFSTDLMMETFGNQLSTDLEETTLEVLKHFDFDSAGEIGDVNLRFAEMILDKKGLTQTTRDYIKELTKKLELTEESKKVIEKFGVEKFGPELSSALKKALDDKKNLDYISKGAVSVVNTIYDKLSDKETLGKYMDSGINVGNNLLQGMKSPFEKEKNLEDFRLSVGKYSTAFREKFGVNENLDTSSLGKGIGDSIIDSINDGLSEGKADFDSLVDDMTRKLDQLSRAISSAKAELASSSSSSSSGTPRFKKYANGGVVDTGQLFIANEAGPELVGSIGNRTAVANTNQMVQAISNGVYNAMASAMANQNTRPINVTSNLVVDKRTLATATSQGAIQNGFDGGLSGFDI